MSNPHLDATKEWLEYSAEQNPDNDGRAMHAAALAQTEATLALAFEARTANLLTQLNGLIQEGIKGQDVIELELDILTRLGLGDPK